MAGGPGGDGAQLARPPGEGPARWRHRRACGSNRDPPTGPRWPCRPPLVAAPGGACRRGPVGGTGTMTLRRILRRDPVPVPAALASTLPPLLARVYASRRVVSGEELDYSLARLLPYSRLKGIEGAATLLAEVMATGGRVLVVGDYDADGATSTALIMGVLRALGHRNLAYLVPNRFEFGDGLSPEIV